jgi:chemotaxis protein methyltransferase CheR
LLEDRFPNILSGTNALDLILCRNVFIYLDNPAISRILEKFSACLTDGGYLLLGPSDITFSKLALLQLRQHAGQCYYCKTVVTPPAQRTSVMAPTITPPVAPPPTPSTPASSAPSASAIAQLLEQENWRAAATAASVRIDRLGETATLLQYRAKAYASLGELEQALADCQRAIALEAFDKQGYLLYSLVLLEANRLDEAEGALRRALYLDLRFIEAHYQLALLRLRKGQHEAAMKSLLSALRIAESEPAESHLQATQGMTHGRFAELLRREFALPAPPSGSQS